MSCDIDQLLRELHRACPAMEYKPLRQRYCGICNQLDQGIDEDVNNGLTSPEEAALDKAVFPIFVAFLLPPPSASAIVHVLSQIEKSVMDLFTVNDALTWATSFMERAFSDFRQRIIALSNKESSALQSPPPASYPHRMSPLYRLHVDCHQQPAYRPLALLLTLRLQVFWMVLHAKYDAKARNRRVDGLHDAAMARRGFMARQIVFISNKHLRTLNFPIRFLIPEHFEEGPLPPDLDKYVRRLLISRRHYAKGKRGEPIDGRATRTSTPSTIRTTYGALPSTLAEQTLRIETIEPPEDVDLTAIPQSEFERPTIDDHPAHPELPRERSLQPFLNHQRQIKRAQMAAPSRHDGRILALSEYQALIRRLPLTDPLIDTTHKNVLRSSITLAVLLYGQDPTTIVETAITELAAKPRPFREMSDSVRLIYARSDHSLSYDFPPDWLGYTGSNDHPFLRFCIATTPRIRLPLLPPLADLFEECYWINVGRIHRDSQRDGKALLFAHPQLPSDPAELVNHIDRWLSELEPPTDPGRWTLKGLKESWFVHATQTFHTDPIIAFYISSQRQWTVRSPSQYTALPAARVVRELKTLHTTWWNMLRGSM